MSNFETFALITEGNISTAPSIFTGSTVDALDDIIAVGYMDDKGTAGIVKANDVININYDDTSTFPLNTDLQAVFGIFQVNYDGTNWTLLLLSGGGSIVLPVTAGHFAIWADNIGGLEDLGYAPSNPILTTVAMVDKSTTINGGDMGCFVNTNGTIGKQPDGAQYSINGTLQTRNAIYASTGGFVAYSTTSAGYLAHTCQASLIHGIIITSPTALAQDTTCYLVDPATASCTIPVIAQHPVTITAGHLIAAGSTAGTLVDGGAPGTSVVSTSGVSTMQAASEIIFDHTTPQTLSADAVTINKQSGVIQTGTLTTAAGATYTFTLNNSFLTSNSNIQLTLQYGDNTTKNIECVIAAPPGSGVVTISLINNNAGAMNGNMKIYFFIPY
jgi:hypothetical protein